MLAVASQLFMACGLVDFDLDDETPEAVEMHLNFDTVYVMVGDEFALSPEFTPDSVSNHEIYWTSSADSVVTAFNNTLYALSEGEAMVSALSVQNRISDSCYVYVMPRWEVASGDYPHDMVVYAHVTVHGQEPNENMLIGAFRGLECRGIGEWKEWQGKRYMQIRVYSEMMDDEDGVEERIRFLCYDRTILQVETFPQRINYDGGTHGSLSSLFELTIP